MRQWRVGSLSMGLLLIASGAGLLYAQFNKIAVFDLLVKWWPLIFILLGAEILLQTYLNKNENIKLKYDVFSMFIVIIIVFTGLGIYSAGEVGLIDRARSELNSRNYAIQQTAEIPLGNGISRMVLETGGTAVKVETTSSNSIIVHSTLQVHAPSRPEAEAKLEANDNIWQNRSGNTLFLSLKNSGNGWTERNTVIVPENINVEIDLQSSSLDLNLASAKSNWTLQGPGSCKVKVSENADLLINTIINEDTAIGGNLVWSKNGTPTHAASRAEESDAENQTQACSTLGKGTYKLNIINADDLIINKL